MATEPQPASDPGTLEGIAVAGGAVVAAVCNGARSSLSLARLPLSVVAVSVASTLMPKRTTPVTWSAPMTRPFREHPVRSEETDRIRIQKIAEALELRAIKRWGKEKSAAAPLPLARPAASACGWSRAIPSPRAGDAAAPRSRRQARPPAAPRERRGSGGRLRRYLPGDQADDKPS